MRQIVARHHVAFQFINTCIKLRPAKPMQSSNQLIDHLECWLVTPPKIHEDLSIISMQQFLLKKET